MYFYVSEFEDKKNTLKLENRKLKDRLNDALKRIVMLEKRFTHTLTGSGNADFSSTPILTSTMEPKYETCKSLQILNFNNSLQSLISIHSFNYQLLLFCAVVITAPDGTETTGLASFAPDNLDGHGGNGLPTIIALNNSNQVLVRKFL